MANLTKDQVRQIVQNAPDKSKIIDDLIARGHKLEGYDEIKSSMGQEPKRSLLGTAGEFGKGVLKGIGSTAFGIGQLADKVIPGQLLPSEKPESLKPQNAAQKAGFGVEQFGEFLIPGGAAIKGIKAIEGASALNKLSKLGKLGKLASGTAKLAGKAGVGALEAGGVRALQTGGDVEEIKSAATAGAFAPVAISGALKLGKGIASPFIKSSARKAEQKALLEAGKITDARIAGKTLEAGRVVDDPIAKEVIRQGVPEADVALMKGASNADKIKMEKMLNIREGQITNKRLVDRATDVVGNTFKEKLAQPIETLNKEAGKRLETESLKLAGKRIDPSKPIVDFANELDSAGIKIGKRNKLNFKGSNFEGLKGVQGLINNVWKRSLRLARTGDALQAHRIKSYIDEIVSYGKQAEGLSGKAQNTLKSLRRGIDSVLDEKFPSYNKVNTQFSDTIKVLDELGANLGRKFKLGDTFADAQSGLAMRKILSNTQSRAEILKMLDNMQKLGKKYGVKIDEDVITQANFADTLESFLGSEAPTSFLGQIEKGVDVASSGLVKGAIKAGKYAIEATRGINQKAKIDAIRKLLQTGRKARTVFGKPKQ